MMPLKVPTWITERPIAHRGLHEPNSDRVENSKPAIAAALEAGYAIEIDLQQTQDHKAVVFHDYTLDRLTDRMGQVIDFTQQKLESVEVIGSNSNILSLGSLLALVAGRSPLFIEIKANRKTKNIDKFCTAIISELRDYIGPAAVMSFHPMVIKYFAEHAPDIPRGMVLETHKKWWHLSTGWRRFRYCSIANPHFIAHDVRTLPDRFTEKMRAEGVPLVTWTVRTPEDEAIAAAHADQPIFEYPARPEIR